MQYAGADTYRDTLLLLPIPVLLVAVAADGNLACELANPAWRASCDPTDDATSLEGNLPPRRRAALLDALRTCAATGMPGRVDDLHLSPQGGDGRVRRIVCCRTPAPRGPRVSGPWSPIGQIPAPRGAFADDRRTDLEAPPSRPTTLLTAAQLQALVDNSPDLITRFDRNGRRLFVNRAVAEVHGRPAQDLIGTTLQAIGRHSSSGMHPDSAARLGVAIQQVFDSAEAAELEVVYMTSGDPVIVQYKLVPETDSSGAVVSALLIGRDITHIKRIEQELAASRSRYREVFDNALDQMVLLEVCENERYRIIAANPAMLNAMGRARAEVVGHYQDQVLEPAADQVLKAAYRRCLNLGGPVESELELPTRHGPIRLQSTISPTRDHTGRITRLVSVVRDVTDLEHAERTQRRLNRSLQTLSNANITLIRATDEPSLLDGMCDVMIKVGGYAHAWIGVLDPDDHQSVIPRACSWKYADRPHPDLEPRQRQVQLEAMASLTPLLSGPDVVGSIPATEYSSNDGDHGHPGHTTLTLPLFHDTEVIGVLVVEADDLDGFRPDEIALLGELAADLSFGLHNLRRLHDRGEHEERLVEAMYATIQALADTTELRDPYTAGHQRRVAQLAEAVGRRMGLSDDRVAGLYLASTIHDIGKISVPAEILSRPGRLSAIEYELMQQHVTAAYDLLKNIEFPWPVAEIVYQHHERFDGSGYPRGLKGDELLLEARILAASDVVEAIASHRPYRPGLGMDVALRELQDGRGTRYDAKVVDACLGLLSSGRFSFQ